MFFYERQKEGLFDKGTFSRVEKKRGKVTESQKRSKTRMVTELFDCKYELQTVTQVTERGEKRMSNIDGISDLERAAMKNEPMPDGLKFYDQMYFQALRYLYLQYSSRQMPREQGTKEKQRMRVERDRLARESESVVAYSKYYADTYTALAQASIAYAKERTLENADAMYEALYHSTPRFEHEKK